MKKRRILTLVLASVLALSLFACGKKEDTETETTKTETKEEEVKEPQEAEVIVFAAASMTETLGEIADAYKEVAPNVTLTFNFDSSGTLKTQITEGADCDVFISAAQKQMNEIDAASDEETNPDGLDLVLQGTRVDLLKNEVNLCVPDANPKGIESFDDLAAQISTEGFLFGMGNSDVPVGQYTEKILTYFNLDEAALAAGGNITYGTNVKEVTTWVSEGSVDAGVVYATDAYSAGLKVVDAATTEMCGDVVYPAAVLIGTQNEDAAKAFLEYLQSDEAMKVFEKVGFKKA